MSNCDFVTFPYGILGQAWYLIVLIRLWLKAVTEPNSAIHTAIAEWTRPESTENDGSVRFSDTGI